MFQEGDILLLVDGRILRVLDTTSLGSLSDMILVQFIDRSESTFVDKNTLDIESNLGRSGAALANFHAIHGIHLRLNNLSKV
jgi:hypothetical protein